jgi:trehalose/maltose hydrolase-like predicted phosphorylase
MAARVDLDDLTGTTGGGLHLAAAGSVWQAIVYGFLGAWPRPDGTLRLDPHLPRAWSGLTVALSFHGRPLRLHASHARLEVDCHAPVRLLLAGHRHLVEPPGRAFQRTEGIWRPRGGGRRGPDPRRAR